MEEWYELIPDVTFKTIFEPISIDEANTFINAYQMVRMFAYLYFVSGK